jgi:hypothetical protein
MEAPVVAALPAELLAFDAELRGDQDRARLVEQPVRGWLTGTERSRRVEAVEHAKPIKEQQPILRPTPRREEQQRQLIGSEQLLLVEHPDDFAVTLGQMPGQLEHPLRAHPHRPRITRRRRRTTNRPIYVGACHAPDHAQRRAFPRPSEDSATPPEAPPMTPAEPPPETPARFRTASSSRSASSATASRRCSSLSRTRRGGSSLKSVFLVSHCGTGRGARTTTTQESPNRSLPIERPFWGPKSDTSALRNGTDHGARHRHGPDDTAPKRRST